MASGNEHRMVFDIRGKRRHVVKAVYAILAILMAASLFLVVGPVNIGSLLGTSSSGENNLAEEYEKRAERIETELQKQPGEEKLLANLTNNRMLAGQQRYAAGPNGEALPTTESRTQYQKASAAWSEYLEAAKEPTASLAQRMAGVLFTLAQLSRSYPEAEANISAAAEAQKMYAEERPTLNSLSTQALYMLYAGDFEKAEEVNAAAEKAAGTKFQREQVGNQFDSAKKNATEFQKQLDEAEKASREAAKGNGSTGNPESLENPLGSALGGSTGLAE
jgi:Skp family chaperone for outer membrane proteins